MHQSLTIEGPLLEQGAIAERIMRALGRWFGIESSIVEYREAVETMPTFIATWDGEPVGFMAVERHFPESAELHVLAVLESHHRRGIGAALLQASEQWLQQDKCRWLQVKTVSDGRQCDAYAQSRLWYSSMGFEPLQVFPLLWDESNPCLQLIKQLD